MGTRPKIDINTAHVVKLTAVKGIGKSRAETIVRYRDKNGPFTSVDDLDRVPHIGDMPPDELLQVKTYFTVAGAGDTAPPTAPEQVDVSVANVEELRSVEGIGSDRAQEIVQYRAEHGPIRDLGEPDALPHFPNSPEAPPPPTQAPPTL